MTSLTFFFLFIPILAVLLLFINLLLSPHNPYQEKDSVFECGFHSFLGQNRTQFSISFFIFALLFLLFDLEILLVYPYIVSGYTNDIYGLLVMLLFFTILTVGFVFELGKNALKIDSRQISNFKIKILNTTLVYNGFQVPLTYIKFFTLKNIFLLTLSVLITFLTRNYLGFLLDLDLTDTHDTYIRYILTIITLVIRLIFKLIEGLYNLINTSLFLNPLEGDDNMSDIENSDDIDGESQDMPMAGVRCSKCAERGQEVWVIPGKNCHVCGNAC